LLAKHSVAMFGVATLLWIIAEIGIRQSLEAIPWPEKQPEFDPSVLGPPISRRAPRQPVTMVPRGRGLGIGALISWWVFSVSFHLKGIDQAVLIFAVLISVVMGFLRGAIYTSNYPPPINLFGRIFTGRLILPRYDY